MNVLNKISAKYRIAIYYAILCCFCVFACKSEKENKDVSSSSMEKSLYLSLFFFKELYTPYFIDTITGNLVGLANMDSIDTIKYKQRTKWITKMMIDNEGIIHYFSNDGLRSRVCSHYLGFI